MFPYFSIKKKKNLSPLEQLVEWEKRGRPDPPPHIVKQQAVGRYKERFGIEILIEPGTYLGDMIKYQLPYFKKIYSVELNKKLYHRAKKKFAKYPHVHLYRGDSGEVLDKITCQLSAPALFWLDGHYSGGITSRGAKECPVVEELNIILKSNFQHVVLIDDARLFNVTNDYPTIEEIETTITKSRKSISIHIENDIIILTPFK